MPEMFVSALCKVKFKAMDSIPALLSGATLQSRCLARVWDCSQESPVARTAQQLPSCGQSFLALAREPSPIARAPYPRRTPCMHASTSSGLAAALAFAATLYLALAAQFASAMTRCDWE